ncbi:NLRC5 [Symbiodinium sp. CCMP2592]|nr:NLRC5 [Symbiodinium sp. CCMP2592]
MASAEWPDAYYIPMPVSSGLVRHPHPPPWPAEAPMVHQGLSSEAQEFDPFSMPAAVSLLDQPGQPLVYVWVEDYYEDSCSVGAVQLEATQLQGEDGDAHFGMVENDMGQQGLRVEAPEFVPKSMSTAVFSGPSAPVRAGRSRSEDSCSVGDVPVEASQPEGEDDDVHCGAQTTRQKKSGKRLINARLPLKKQGAKQQEVTAQARSLEIENTRTLQADGAGDVPTPKLPSEHCQSDILPANPCAVAQAPGWRLLTRSERAGVQVERMLQVDPRASDLPSGEQLGCPASEAAVAEPNTYGLLEFKHSHMHDGKKHDPVIARSSESSVEEPQVADVDSWAPPAFADEVRHGSEDPFPPQSSPTTSSAASSVLGSPSQKVEPDGILPLQVEPGVEYDRGWIKYKDPESGEIWFHNDHTDDYFFAGYSRQWGWLPYQSKSGQRWWWHDKRKMFFFEGLK